MKIALSEDNKTGIYYRSWTSDLMTIRRVARMYNTEDLESSDVVLDMGAHIGCYTYYAANKVKQVIAFEPDPTSFKIARYNNRNNNNVTIVNAAIVANNDKQRKLYKTSTNSEGSHSLHVKSRKEFIFVKCLNYFDTVEKYRPTVIKAHLEGEEFFVYDRAIEKYVRMFIADFHLKKKTWRKLFYEIRNNLLTKQGFEEQPKTKLTNSPRTVVLNLRRDI